MSDLTEFSTTVIPEVPGCPPEVAVNAIRDALRVFCARSCAWRKTLDPIDTVVGQASYTVLTPVDSEVAVYLDVRQGGRRLGVATISDFAAVDSWRTQSDDQSQWYIVETPTMLQLNPIPKTTAAEPITITAALKPTRTATTADDLLLDSYQDVIASGALFKLLMMRGRAWSDPNSALFHQKMFQEALSGIRKETALGSGVGTLSALVPPLS